VERREKGNTWNSALMSFKNNAQDTYRA
jgi:hypothetical protein